MRRRRTYRRSYSRKNRLNLRVFTFPVKWHFNVPMTDPTGPVTQWNTFALNQASDTRYATLFDEYRIKKVRFVVRPVYNVAQQGFPVPAANPSDGNNLTAGLMNVESVIDYNSAVTFTNTSALNDYPSYKCTRGGQVHVRTLEPRINTPIWRGATSSSAYLARKPGWIGTQYPDVPHFGLAVRYPAMPILPATTAPGWLVEVTMTVQFRGIDSQASGGITEDINDENQALYEAPVRPLPNATDVDSDFGGELGGPP